MSCEDQACPYTYHCTKCRIGFHLGSPIYAPLERREGNPFWWCTCCNASYGTNPAPGLQERVDRAMAEFNKLSPEQKREHRALQRKSWVVGEMMLGHPAMSRTEAEALYDKMLEGP